LFALEPVDIRANLLDMFEQGRRDGSAEVILDSEGREPAQRLAPGPSPQGDLFQQLQEQQLEAPLIPPAAPGPAQQDESRPAGERMRSTPIRRGEEGEAHLPLTEMEITISGPEDLQRLQQEFDAARQRQQQAR
jgi:hypothetical protein